MSLQLVRHSESAAFSPSKVLFSSRLGVHLHLHFTKIIVSIFAMFGYRKIPKALVSLQQPRNSFSDIYTKVCGSKRNFKKKLVEVHRAYNRFTENLPVAASWPSPAASFSKDHALRCKAPPAFRRSYNVMLLCPEKCITPSTCLQAMMVICNILSDYLLLQQATSANVLQCP